MSIWKGLLAVLVTPVVIMGMILSPLIITAVVIYAFISIDKKELKKTLTPSDKESEDT